VFFTGKINSNSEDNRNYGYKGLNCKGNKSNSIIIALHFFSSTIISRIITLFYMFMILCSVFSSSLAKFIVDFTSIMLIKVLLALFSSLVMLTYWRVIIILNGVLTA
jgi:hypothetical protein